MWNNFRVINLRIKIISRIYLLRSCARKRLIIRLTSVCSHFPLHLQPFGGRAKKYTYITQRFIMFWIFICGKNAKQLNTGLGLEQGKRKSSIILRNSQFIPVCFFLSIFIRKIEWNHMGKLWRQNKLEISTCKKKRIHVYGMQNRMSLFKLSAEAWLPDCWLPASRQMYNENIFN